MVAFNRGGNGECGKLTPWSRFGFYPYVSNGFVVLASQSRGNDGGEGHEEYGGADVRDVLHLLPLARALGYVDMHNVFMLGWSCGGMTTYLRWECVRPVVPPDPAPGPGATGGARDRRREPRLVRGADASIP